LESCVEKEPEGLKMLAGQMRSGDAKMRKMRMQRVYRAAAKEKTGARKDMRS
jgi:hypothetical protein